MWFARRWIDWNNFKVYLEEIVHGALSRCIVISEELSEEFDSVTKRLKYIFIRTEEWHSLRNRLNNISRLQNLNECVGID